MKIHYIYIEVKLFNCVEDPGQLIKDLKEWLNNKLEKEYESDIEAEIIESAGWK